MYPSGLGAFLIYLEVPVFLKSIDFVTRIYVASTLIQPHNVFLIKSIKGLPFKLSRIQTTLRILEDRRVIIERGPQAFLPTL